MTGLNGDDPDDYYLNLNQDEESLLRSRHSVGSGAPHRQGSLVRPERSRLNNPDNPHFYYAQKTQEAGLAGVVCSAQEVELIKSATSSDFICLTPGIRPAGAAVGDQKRVMTPSRAREIGSDFIVVGRPITQAENPVAAYHMIQKEWQAKQN